MTFNFRQFNRRPAMIHRDTEYSYAWLADQVDAFAKQLATAEVDPGTVVALEADFTPQAVALFFALAAKGCIIVPLMPGLADRTRLLELAGVEYRLAVPAGPESIGLNRCAATEAVHRTAAKRPSGRPSSRHPLYRTLEQRAHPGLVLFSSGTTGEPKAAVHDLQPLLERFAKPRQAYRAIAFLMFDHIGGLNTMLYILSSGGCLVMVENRRPETVLKAVEKHQAELLPVSPTFMNMILLSQADRDYNLDSLQLVSYGTEPMPASTLHRFHQRFPQVRLQQTYGLSEIGIPATRSKASDSLWLSIGGSGVETRVVDNILQVRSRTAMLGYLNAPSPFTEDGWLDTGDAVEVDGE